MGIRSRYAREMPSLRLALLVSLLSLTGASGPATNGIFARDARSLWSAVAGSPRPVVVRSPDGATRIVARYRETADDGQVTLTVSGRIGVGTVALGPGVNAEILWAADSRAFAVTTSDAGALGPYRTLVIAHGRDGRIALRDLSPIVHRAFVPAGRCDPPETPNVGAVAWEDGSARLIVAGEVVPHSSCSDMGRFAVFAVDRRTGQVTARFDQAAAIRRFGLALGRELRAAPAG